MICVIINERIKQTETGGQKNGFDYCCSCSYCCHCRRGYELISNPRAFSKNNHTRHRAGIVVVFLTWSGIHPGQEAEHDNWDGSECQLICVNEKLTERTVPMSWISEALFSSASLCKDGIVILRTIMRIALIKLVGLIEAFILRILPAKLGNIVGVERWFALPQA